MDGYLHYLELARNRQKRYYDSHKDTVKQKKKDDRKELKELRERFAGLGVNAPTAPCDECANQDPIPVVAPVVAPKKAGKPKFDEASVIQALQDSTEFNSENTRKGYISSIRQIFRLTKCTTLQKCLAGYDKIKKLVETGLQVNGKPYSLNATKSLFQAIVYVVDHLKVPIPDATREKYRVLQQIYVGNSKKQTEHNKTNPANAVMLYSTYLGKIKAEFGAKSKQYLVAKMYDEVTVRDDFQLMIISSEREMTSDTQNYLVVPRIVKNNATFVIQSYKTSKKYGIIRQKVSTVLSKQLRDWITENKLSHGDLLFQNKTLSDFVSVMNRAVGASSGINYLRHAKVSEVMSRQVMTDEDRVMFSRRMAHSPMTSLSYVRSIKWEDNE
jgi:hypothetical protein